jgi:hypothetical protein
MVKIPEMRKLIKVISLGFDPYLSNVSKKTCIEIGRGTTILKITIEL